MVLAAGQGEMEAWPLPSGQRHWVSAPYQKAQAIPEISEYRKQVHSPWPLSLEVALARFPPKGVKMTHAQDSPD